MTMVEWDEKKRVANLAKHGVDFARVARFEMSAALVKQDNRQDYGEIREQALGYIAGRLHMLVFTMRGNNLRVISLRRATGKEVALYGQYKAASREEKER